MKPQFHLPLPTYPDGSSFTIIDNAIDLARQSGADLLASIPEVEISPVRQSFPTAIDVDALRAHAESYSRDCGTSLRDHIRDAAVQTGMDVQIHGFSTREPNVYNTFAQIAKTHDLSVLEASDLTRTLTETLLFESGRPVVLFPATSVSGRIDTVAIAWDGSGAAAKAISTARLFLDRATKVQVISIVDDKEIDEKNRALFVSTLKRSGLDVEDLALHAGSQTPASAIQSAAMERKADILIAGGFGHSRLREFILGGVTRELLGECDLPVLMAH